MKIFDSICSIRWCNFKDRCGIKPKIILKKQKISEHFETTWFLLPSTHFTSFLVPPRLSRGPSQHKSGSLNRKDHPTSQSKAKIQLPMYKPLPSPRQSHSQNNSKTLPGPWPNASAASTAAPAEISCSTTAAWRCKASRHSTVSPRASSMRRGRRGGMFVGVVRQKNVYIYIYIIYYIYYILYIIYICHNNLPNWYLLYLLVWGMAKNKRSNHRKICSCFIVLFKSYNQLHLIFATSRVAYLENISWITLDYASAVKSGHYLTDDCQEKRKGDGSCEGGSCCGWEPTTAKM